MLKLEDIERIYFCGDHERMICCIHAIGQITGINIEPIIKELDKITHEEY